MLHHLQNKYNSYQLIVTSNKRKPMKDIRTLPLEVCTAFFHTYFISTMASLCNQKRRTFSKKEKKEIFERCCRKCFYCHIALSFKNSQKGERGAWNADHLLPDARDGATTIVNGVAACFDCNSKKSAMTHTKFIKKFGGIGDIDNFVRCHF